MYHYVREVAASRFPGIKGLEIAGFRRQLDHLVSNYSIVTQRQVMDAFHGGEPLPPAACWLTFDDGYKDHYTYVLPELVSRGLAGTFFVPSRPILESVILDVHAIQHVIASATDEGQLVRQFYEECKEFGIGEDYLDKQWSAYASPNRFDSGEIIFLKRMLQHVLPRSVRREILAKLLPSMAGLTEEELAAELYLSFEEAQQLVRAGMSVGAHTHTHPWLNRIGRAEKLSELEASRTLITRLGADSGQWSMAYPYGAYDAETIELAQGAGCALAVTTNPTISNIRDEPLILGRLDTNDFPQ